VSQVVSGLSQDAFLADRSIPPLFRCARLVAEVRNRTKGHGVMTDSVVGRLLPELFSVVARMLFECREVLGMFEIRNPSGTAPTSPDPAAQREPFFSGRPLTPWLKVFPEHDDVGYLVGRTSSRSEYLLYNAGLLLRPSRLHVESPLD